MNFLISPSLIPFPNSNGKIEGSIKDRKLQDVSLPNHEVKAFLMRSNQLIRKEVTDHNGDYQFTCLPNEPIFIVSHYIDSSKNGEMADNIIPQRDPVYDQIID